MSAEEVRGEPRVEGAGAAASAPSGAVGGARAKTNLASQAMAMDDDEVMRQALAMSMAQSRGEG